MFTATRGGKTVASASSLRNVLRLLVEPGVYRVQGTKSGSPVVLARYKVAGR